MKIILAGGGTGGHINPALSVADYIRKIHPDAEIRFVGTKRGLEKRLVPAAGYPIDYIDICGFDRRRLWRNFGVLIKLFKANRDCVKLMKEFCPDAVVCTGGYVSGPVAVAAKRAGVPALIHEQNVYPGLTVKGSQRYVDYVAVSFEETVDYLEQKEKCVVTGNPVRSAILEADAQKAREKLGLSEKPFVLVFGGSLGAEVLNRTMLGMMQKLVSEAKVQLLFGTGERNYEAVTEELRKMGISFNDEVRVVPYIDNMADVMAAADLVVARSGAITVSEIAALGKASILIPSPNVVRNHQEQNARAFEKQDAAVVITEDVLTPELLYEKITGLAENPRHLKQMGNNVQKLAKRNALAEIYNLIDKMVKNSQNK
ncbi:MAG: undecaprenyldiphospho-muramoylpentapeptide beta-N-acetylglucosaminyltransferase [Ruminococcaceae bacterium]|nr:undecaprenyldiphospho-muramoylpentapeptide beta-N-acetylglucosaminyltransferase [Oscillospiraceae bacterium]